jgi:hypothetical protein
MAGVENGGHLMDETLGGALSSGIHSKRVTCETDTGEDGDDRGGYQQFYEGEKAGGFHNWSPVMYVWIITL